MTCQNLKKAWSGEDGPHARVSKKVCGLIRERLKEAKWSGLASSLRDSWGPMQQPDFQAP